jgi:hypothetical protein
MWRAAVLGVVACSGAAAPASGPPKLSNTAQPVVPAAQPVEPTEATAGAKTCTLGEAVLLGPHGEESAIVGFDRGGGLAVWKRDKTVLALQAITLAGTPRGAQVTVALPEGIVPKLIYPLGDRFVVLVRKWDWQRNELDWWGLVADRSGKVTALPAQIGLADVDITRGEIVDGRRISLYVGPGAISKDLKRPARTQLLTVTATGIASTATAVMATAAGPPPRDAIGFSVINRATARPGGGAGPGGMIIEPMGQPALERTQHAKRFGDPVALEWQGNPIAHGMYVESYIVWSGTHFIYPFYTDDGGPTHDKYVERLLPIDCKP